MAIAFLTNGTKMTFPGSIRTTCGLASFQQAYAHGRHLDDVLVVPDVARKHGGPLRGEAAGVQLHDLLARLQDLQGGGCARLE